MRTAQLVVVLSLLSPHLACKREEKPKASTAELAAFIKTYGGAWKGPGMELTIDSLGMVRYQRGGTGATNKSFTAPLSTVDAKSFTVGLLGLTTTFRIDRPPHEEGGALKMTIDGVELTRIASAGPRAPGIAICTRLDGDLCADPASELPASVEKIQMSALVEKAAASAGPSFLIVWIAEDVGESAPANHTIAETPLTFQEDPSKLTGFTIKASLSRPTKGWPLGKYRVEVRTGGKTVQTARFTIVAAKGAGAP